MDTVPGPFSVPFLAANFFRAILSSKTSFEDQLRKISFEDHLLKISFRRRILPLLPFPSQ
jgi:hypothetical protein